MCCQINIECLGNIHSSNEQVSTLYETIETHPFPFSPLEYLGLVFYNSSPTYSQHQKSLSLPTAACWALYDSVYARTGLSNPHWFNTQKNHIYIGQSSPTRLLVLLFKLRLVDLSKLFFFLTSCFLLIVCLIKKE